MSSKASLPAGITQKGDEYHVRVQKVSRRTGKKVQRRGRAPTLKEALALRDELLHEIDYGRRTNKLTLTDYAQQWLERKVLKGLKPGSIDVYRVALEQHILPHLGDRLLDSLMPRDVDEFVAAELRRGIKPKTLQTYIAVLNQISKKALRDEYTTRLFCFDVELPPVPKLEEDENVLTAEQLDRFLQRVQESWPGWYVYVLILGTTGLRQSELHALRWEDVRWDDGFIDIRQGSYRGVAQAPKTAASIRKIPLGPELAEALHAHRLWQQKHRPEALRAGLIMGTRTGTIYTSCPIGYVCHQLGKELGLRHKFTPHGLRHTFVTLVNQATTGAVARRMAGHATARQNDHYNHVQLEQMAAAQEGLFGLLKKSPSRPQEPRKEPRLRVLDGGSK